MSQDRPERPPTARFLDALEVKRNAKIGLLSGVVVATALFVFFVALAPDTRGSPIYYVGLAFVVATTLAGAIAVVLTIRSAIALSRELEDVDRPEDV
ncbi:hypothetical protein ACFOZ7_19945 [Natribaculum luteum]|uniref:DUF485 domain-containing protein n=1 Tax=Natribaculum luteum TaxID=1586232 RepID=A0ABD5P4J0_9EURY|nr:hypothetical protein [Natribaculum luteum]